MGIGQGYDELMMLSMFMMIIIVNADDNHRGRLNTGREKPALQLSPKHFIGLANTS